MKKFTKCLKELAGPSRVYRNVAHLKEPSLYRIPRKERGARIKEADVCGVKEGKVQVIVEEYMETCDKKEVIDKITSCNYLLVGEQTYPFSEAILFVVFDDPDYQTSHLPSRNDISKIVLCSKEKFPQVYSEVIG